MAAHDMRLDKSRRREGRSLGGLLRKYDRGGWLRFWRRPRARSASAPRRWGASGILGLILSINLGVLIPVIAGMIIITAQRSGLTDERIQSLSAQGRIVAQLVTSEATVETDQPPILTEPARQAMMTALETADIRGRLFVTSGEKIVDTRHLFLRNQIEVDNLPLPGASGRTLWMDFVRLFESAYSWVVYGRDLPVFDEMKVRGIEDFPEVLKAMQTGEVGSARRINPRGAMLVSVAVPVKRVETVRGVLLLTTEAGDVDAIVARDRLIVGALALTGLAFGALVSYFMARWIAAPIRKLAHAAERVRSGDADETAIPHLPSAPDEIRALAASFRAMTAALTERLGAIENFAADVSHEIKNPLTSIRSAIETLARTSEPERVQKLMKLIQNDVRRIDRLISDISEASRLDAELSREKASHVEIGAFLQNIVSLYQDQDPPLPVTFVLDLGDASLNARVHGREGALAQVFRNILDNAISFSPQDGEIRIAVTATERYVRVTVADEGPGIPPESVDKVFDRFYTHRPSSHGFGKNSGLGLSISKQIVESHDGTIAAANRQERSGAIFTVTLPLA
jgi:two-component system sensor histidine kinase ChvG